MTEALFVYITAADRDEALAVGRALVEARLAACANVVGGMRSIYWWRGAIEERRNGALISTANGEAVPYALYNLEDRGVMFIGPGTKVYRGMVIGEHTRGSDLEVNPLKTKQLTNIRAAGKDDAVRLTTPRPMRLEEAISYIADDELVEITPRNIRLRKALLDPHARKRAQRAAGRAS